MSCKIRAVSAALGALLTVLPLSSAAPPFGLQIYSCTVPGVIAPGFDDGPGIYSEDVLNRQVNSWNPGLC